MIGKARCVTCSIIAVLTVFACSSSGQTPTFTRSDITIGNFPVSLAVADFNGDGKPDIAVLANTTSTAVLSIFLGDGTGNFTLTTSFSTGFASTWLTAGDLNGDGLADLVVANSFSRSVSVFLATGSGTFGARSDISLPGRIESVLLADFNGDHKLDVAAPNFESAPQYSVSILLGNGDGTFGPNTEYPTLDVPFVVVVDDFNSDGKLDLAINGQFGGVSVLLGNGDGTFQPKKDSSTGFAQSSHIASGDFNGDSKADLAVANNADDSVSILLGNGDGTFQLQPPISIPVTPFRLAVGDFNGDGFVDLVVARRNSAKVSILFGKGDGTFLTSAEFDVGAGPQFVTVKDLNGDGKLDVVTANYDGGTISILLNSTGTPPAPQIKITPNQITFPPTLLNTRSAPVTVTISNPGTAVLLISDISTQNPFAIINPSPNIGNILPATTATFDTIFTPTGPGPYSGNVTITSNAPTSPTVIPMQGTVIIPPPATGTINVTTNTPSATFLLTGPSSLAGSGQSASFTNVTAGTYTITYGPTCRSDLPSPQMMTLGAGTTIAFSGTYAPGFLSVFPLAGFDACTATINAVFDHSQTSPYRNDFSVVAYTGESGVCNSNNPLQDFYSIVGSKQPHSGYRNQTGSGFTVNDHYAGGENGNGSSARSCAGVRTGNLPSNTFLFYDGHPGYDYRAPCGTPVRAAVSGTVRYPDSIPGIPNARMFHVLELDPDAPNNGYRIYYLHLSTYPPSKYPSCDSAPAIIPPNCNGKACHVTAGQVIGDSGDAGVPLSPHLHFEIQITPGIPVDPYGWKGIPGSDPYRRRATNVNLWP